jgi:hypothetical protein
MTGVSGVLYTKDFSVGTENTVLKVLAQAEDVTLLGIIQITHPSELILFYAMQFGSATTPTSPARSPRKRP